MDSKNCQLLTKYIELYDPLWEVRNYPVRETDNIYKFWVNDTSHENEKGLEVVAIKAGEWKHDGCMSWEAVQIVVNAHKTGFSRASIGELLCRKASIVQWEVK